MTTTLQDAPPQKCSLVRACFPLLALALGAVLVTGVWLWPVEDMPRLYRVLGTYAAVGLTVLLSLLWLLFFSPFSRSKRLLILVGVVGIPAGGFAACVRKVDFYGDLVPIITWRWDPTAKSNNPQLGAFPKDADLSGARPTDFPEYRGRQRDGVVNGPDLARDWSVKPPRKLWRQPNHPGHSGFAIANGAAVTLEQRDDQEAIVCYDVATGQERWLRSYTARFKELLGGEGPRSTPTIRNGEVYSLGATGKLVCLDAASGKENWMADVLENNKNAKWGLAGSPLVFEDKVVVNPGAQTPQAPGTLAAYDRKTGKRLWASGQAVAGYSSPMLATLSGKPQILLLDGEGLSGYAPADGKELWRHPWPVQEDINVAQPVLLGDDQVFISSGYGVGGAALEIKETGGAWTVKQLWKNNKLRCKFTSPVRHAGHLYGLDEGVLVCLDAKTGERKWRGDRYGHGQLLLTNGLLLILSEEGELALVEATPTAYRKLTQLAAIEGRTWNVPALADGRVFVRNGVEMACYDLAANRQ